MIDEESHPGVLAEMLNSSSSSDASESSSSSDSDASSGSHTTAKRIKRVLRGRKRRKSSASSKDTPSLPSTVGTPAASNFNSESVDVISFDSRNENLVSNSQPLGAILSGDEADTDGENEKRFRRTRDSTINSRDFENEKRTRDSKSPEAKPGKKSKKKHHHRKHSHDEKEQKSREKNPPPAIPENEAVAARASTQRVAFAQQAPALPENSPKRPLTLRSITGVRPIMPTMPRMLSSTVFSAANPTGLPCSGPQGTGITPRALHRSNSLPSRLNQTLSVPAASVAPTLPAHASLPALDPEQTGQPKKHMSRTAAIILLLISTALVAVCAEFLVDSINYLVGHTSVSEAFIGLIVLPIVGNAAEHVCAVTVASKNKMDLAIGVAVGSSIQIALFVTPVIVLLGWILQKDMSLYFSLFETVSLFVTAFVVNFLVLDGRSNYLEGALLIAAYVIIALAAFFYPDSDQQSQVGGAEEARRMLRLL